MQDPFSLPITGQYAVLRPISAAEHSQQLCQNLKHQELWTFFYARPFDLAAMNQYIRTLQQQKLEGTVNYAICNQATGEALGFLGIDVRHQLCQGSIELVNVMFSLKLQKTTIATEAVFLAAVYCFENRGCKQLLWRCDISNKKSFNAATRFGFTYLGVNTDRNKEYHFFRMARPQWEEIKSEYIRWLNPANFDEQGVQKSKLTFRRATQGRPPTSPDNGHESKSQPERCCNCLCQ